MYETLALYIDGEFIGGDGRKTEEVSNPSTLEVLGHLPHASTADLDRALAAAARAFETWRNSSPIATSRMSASPGMRCSSPPMSPFATGGWSSSRSTLGACHSGSSSA